VHDVAELMALTAGASRGVALRRARTGIRAAELLRRIGLPFAGEVSEGALELTEGHLMRWLRPEALAPVSTPFNPKLRGLPGTGARLPEELKEQGKRLRSNYGEPPPFTPPER
jgi:hypothetical protein